MKMDAQQALVRMIDKGISFADLGKSTGIDAAYLSKIIGKAEPVVMQLKTIHRIGVALDMQPSDLAYFDQKGE